MSEQKQLSDQLSAFGGKTLRNSKVVLIDKNPGRNAQTMGIARELGTDIELIHEPSIGVIGNKGDSQCYLGVQKKSRKNS